MELNPSQKEAVLFKDGPCMVLAGPGSGKTAVITRRAVTLVQTYRIEEKHILIVTFTKAAAEEMKRRYLKESGRSDTEIVFGTFHAIFYSMLRQGYSIGHLRVIGEGERTRLIEEVIRETDASVVPDRELVAGLMQEISYVKNHRIAIGSYESGTRQIRFEAVFRGYEKRMNRGGMIDFDDMLGMTLEMLEKKSEELTEWRQRYHYIMIDEFQDVNPLQYEIIKLLAAPKNNLFIVGDDDQSIYGFRGARPGIMLDFPKEFKDVKRILLGMNYRSGETIVAHSLKLINRNETRFKKRLRAARPGGRVEIREFPTDVLEYEAVTEEIGALIQRGVRPEEIAILTRTNGGASGILQRLLEKSIPFISKDRIPNLYAHFICKPLFACFNFIAGNRTRANLFRFMNCPGRYLRREDFKTEIVDFEEMIKDFKASPDRRYMEERIRTLDNQLKFMARLEIPYAMIHFFRKYMGYDAYVREEAEKSRIEAEKLLQILDEIQASARPYDTVEAWYAYVAKFSRSLKELSAKDRENKTGKVTVSTLHASKGLEYRFVFLIDMNERSIPHEKAKKPEEIEEERRLLYVGMTRAAEGLMLYYSKNRFGRDSEPSRFLRELN